MGPAAQRSCVLMEAVMGPDASRRFWDRFAGRYAARPIKDVQAHEALLADMARRLKPSDSVLEIGCGTGLTAVRLAPGVARYAAADLSPQMIRIARARLAAIEPRPASLAFRVADAETALEESPFDAVCALNVLHLVDDMPGLLGRIHGALRPGGLLLSKTGCFAELNPVLRLLFRGLRLIGLFPPASFLRCAEIERALTAAGFEIVDRKVFGAFPQNPYVVARRPLTGT